LYGFKLSVRQRRFDFLSVQPLDFCLSSIGPILECLDRIFFIIHRLTVKRQSVVLWRDLEAQARLLHQRNDPAAEKLQIWPKIKEAELQSVDAGLLQLHELIDHLFGRSDDLDISTNRPSFCGKYFSEMESWISCEAKKS
jgi:hypothetical protein